MSGTNRVDFRLALKMDSDRNPWSMTGGQISGVAFLLRSQVASCDCSPTARQHQSKTLGSFALKLDDGLVELKDADGVGSGDRHAKSPEKMMAIILGELI